LARAQSVRAPRRVARAGGARRAWGWDVWAVDSPLVSDVDDLGNVSYEGWFCVRGWDLDLKPGMAWRAWRSEIGDRRVLSF
jgi:hypothetical protein